MPDWVKDESAWAKAKARVQAEYPAASGDRFWRLVTAIYQRMTGATAMSKAHPLPVIFLKAVRRGDTQTLDLLGANPAMMPDTHLEMRTRKDGVNQMYHISNAAPEKPMQFAASAAELRGALLARGIKEPMWQDFQWTTKDNGVHIRRDQSGEFELTIKPSGNGYNWSFRHVGGPAAEARQAPGLSLDLGAPAASADPMAGIAATDPRREHLLHLSTVDAPRAQRSAALLAAMTRNDLGAIGRLYGAMTLKEAEASSLDVGLAVPRVRNKQELLKYIQPELLAEIRKRQG